LRRALDNGVEIARNGTGISGRSHRARSRGGRLADHAHDLVEPLGRPLVRPLPRQHLEQQDAQRVDIRGGRHGLALRLFGARVFGRHHLRPGHRPRGVGRIVGRQQLGDAEVEQAWRAVGGHQDVAGLQVAMDDQVAMGILHGIADLSEQLQALAHAEPLLLTVDVDGHAIDGVHDDERQAGVGGARVDQARDEGVVEVGEFVAREALRQAEAVERQTRP
jgi:hypothetical protein